MDACNLPEYPPVLRTLEESKRGEIWARRALEDEAAMVAGAKNGTRNTMLNNAALKLGRKVAGGYLQQDDVEATLIDAAQQSGLVQEDGIEAVRATINSGLTAGLQEPQHPQDRPANIAALSDPKAEFSSEREIRLPTEFVWRDPSTIPPRPWVYGHHLIRKQVSVTVAPGGVGKSSLTICEALAMASGRELLGDWTAKDLKVWIYNLEDPRDEMDRRIIAAMQHHEVSPQEIAGRLYVDTGRERTLTTAVQTREGVQIIKPELDALANEIEARGIDVLVIDPFVSSHQAAENDNGAIDLVAKEWARLADRCNCAIELVHHTRKTNGDEATTESGRGASALLAAARSGRVLIVSREVV